MVRDFGSLACRIPLAQPQTTRLIHIPMVNPQRAGLTLLRLTGYSLLLLTLFDFIALAIPLRVMDPAWELQTMGSLVERVALPLIGFALVFGGGATQRSRAEIKVLQLLSTAAGLVGVLYFLLLPLLVTDTL
ncbi:MAG: HpsJ family protein, partial [Thermosynechococcaceae cyanobacterium]